MSRLQNEFVQARSVLRAADRAAEAIRRHAQRKCDWDDSVDREEYRKSVRAERREATLKRLVPNMICPMCSRLRASLRSWVITKAEDLAICRSCFQAGMKDKDRTELGYNGERIFGELQPRYLIDGFKLSCIREQLGMSIRRFAELVGWSASYQQTLERSNTRTVSLETAEAILQLFEEHNIRTEDAL